MHFWEPVQIWTGKQFSYRALCNDGHLSVQQCTARHWNIWEIETCMEGSGLPLIFCQSECHGGNFWSFLPGGVGGGRHSERSGSCGCLCEGFKDFQNTVPQLMMWHGRVRLMLMARMSASMAGLWGEKSWRTKVVCRGRLNFLPAKGIFCLLRKASCKHYFAGSHLFLISSCYQLLETQGTASVFWMMMSVHLII